jgi:hypothetical protein
LAALRTGMGRRGFRDVTMPRTAPPGRNSRYLAWIRTLPCLVCGSRRGIEASHTGPHGLGQKSPDTSAIPLCARHHRTGKDSYHKLGPRKFAELHNLDIPAIVGRLNQKPLIRVETGMFIGYLEDQQYLLGTTEDGIASAVRRMSRLCEEDRRCCDFRSAHNPSDQDLQQNN